MCVCVCGVRPAENLVNIMISRLFIWLCAFRVKMTREGIKFIGYCIIGNSYRAAVPRSISEKKGRAVH
jgi:hypothetical protein